jgi:hypothetical protein
MNQKFKDAIKSVMNEEYEVDWESSDSILDFFIDTLSGIDNWPDVTWEAKEDEYDASDEPEALDCENFLFLEIGADFIRILTGGDWQPAFQVVLKEKNNRLYVDSYKLDDENDEETLDEDAILDWVEELRK